MSPLRLALAAFALAALAACGNECSFTTRCNGNNLETCGAGPDQMVNRKIEATPCAAPNPVCVQRSLGGGRIEAACAQGTAPCGTGPTFSCLGSDLLVCDTTLDVQVINLCGDGGPCAAFDGGARCTFAG